MRVSPFGNLGINAYLQLPQAYRSLSRPSSAPGAKAFPLRPLQLDLLYSLILSDQSSFVTEKIVSNLGYLLSCSSTFVLSPQLDR